MSTSFGGDVAPNAESPPAFQEVSGGVPSGRRGVD